MWSSWNEHAVLGRTSTTSWQSISRYLNHCLHHQLLPLIEVWLTEYTVTLLLLVKKLMTLFNFTSLPFCSVAQSFGWLSISKMVTNSVGLKTLLQNWMGDVIEATSMYHTCYNDGWWKHIVVVVYLPLISSSKSLHFFSICDDSQAEWSVLYMITKLTNGHKHMLMQTCKTVYMHITCNKNRS